MSSYLKAVEEKQSMSSYLKAIAGIGMTGLALVGCNFDGASGSGTFSLDVTDAPVDSAKEVNVVFEGVDIKAANGTWVEITYDAPRTIDLLALQGGDTKSLLDSETLAAGEYEQIRLRGQAISNIVLGNDEIHDLSIPSFEQTGLKLVRGFTVPVNGSVSFTIDFDLRKSVVKTGGANPTYILKPALRLIDNTEVGSISGVVRDSTVTNMGGDSACSVGSVVYVYEGVVVEPGDVGSDVEPISSAMVDTQQTGVTEFGYTAAFLVEGDYTVAFTCDGDNDDPEKGGDPLEFVGTQTVTVTAGGTVTADPI